MEAAAAMNRVKAALGRLDPLFLLLLILAVAWFAFSYITNPSRPDLFTPEGWFGFTDQGQYLQMVRELADFGLSAPSFRYGLGYPILAVPFWWLGLSYDPFAVVDGLMFLFIIGGTFIIGRRIGGRLLACIAAFGLLFATPLVGFTLQPWNSTVSTAALVLVLLVATSPKPGLAHAVGLGLAVGWVFAARYVDVVFIGAIALAAVVANRAAWRRRDLLAAAATAAALIAVVLAAHWRVLGSPFTTPYQGHIRPDEGGRSDQEIGAYSLADIPKHFFGMFISPFLLGQRFGGASMLQSAFWFLLAIPGAAIAWITRTPQRAVLMTASVASLLAVAFYTSFHGAGAGSIQFGSLHYVKMWWPLWSLLAGIAICWVASLPRPWLAHRGSEGDV